MSDENKAYETGFAEGQDAEAQNKSSESALNALLCADERTPRILWPALRQYQNNDCSGLLQGFDYREVINILLNAIIKSHMAGQIDAGIDPSYSNAQAYCKRFINT